MEAPKCSVAHITVKVVDEHGILVPNANVQFPYTFYLASSDGSEMYLHDKLFIDNDGLHPAVESFKTTALQSGMHPIKIKYFQDAGG